MIQGDKSINELIKRGAVRSTHKLIVNPASLNIRLGNTFLVHNNADGGIHLGDKVGYTQHEIKDDEEFCLLPGQFALATTIEVFNIPSNLAAYVQGRSSIGRAGLSVQNAGFIDPGFFGQITLELKNETQNAIYLRPGYPIAQIIFEETTPVDTVYNGKYSGQMGATGSRMERDAQDYA